MHDCAGSVATSSESFRPVDSAAAVLRDLAGAQALGLVAHKWFHDRKR